MRSLIPFRTRNAPTRLPSDTAQDSFLALQRDMNRLFDNILGDFGLPAALTGSLDKPMVWPRVEITETDKDIKVSAELPGLTEKDIQVSLQDGFLTLRGEKRSETENKDKDRHFTERFYGHFERNIQIGPDIDESKIAAAFENGVLTIDLPKTEKAQAKAKTIEVKKKG